MGPLYHITEKDERIIAIKESCRLLKDSGVLITSAITPYASLLWAITVYSVKNRLLEEPEFMSMVERELTDGNHIKPLMEKYLGMGNSHFHSADELENELLLGGFSFTKVHGVIGGAWLVPNIDELWNQHYFLRLKFGIIQCSSSLPEKLYHLPKLFLYIS